MFNYHRFRITLFATLSVMLALNLIWEVDLIYFILVAGCFLAVLAYGVFVPSAHFFQPTLDHNPTEANKFSLTFDDGPNEYTKEVLEVLKKHGAQATFFVVGENLEKNTNLAAKIVSQGNELGNHTYSHSNAFPFLSKEKMMGELEKTERLIAGFQPGSVPLFRPPFGVINPTIVTVVQQLQMKLVTWNIRTFDTVVSNPPKVVDKVKKKLKGGDVVLLHDRLPQTPEIVDGILTYAKTKNLTCVTISELFLLEKERN